MTMVFLKIVTLIQLALNYSPGKKREIASGVFRIVVIPQRVTFSAPTTTYS
ncbi:7941_t:CDS:2 [Entrophospora sp. SA101]|nr:7941_t:CDS:2 [Entrophospora sp. SA101]